MKNLDLYFQSLEAEELLVKMLNKPQNAQRAKLLAEAIKSERDLRKRLK